MHYRTRRAEPKGQDLHVLKFGLLAPNYRLDDEDSIDTALHRRAPAAGLGATTEASAVPCLHPWGRSA